MKKKVWFKPTALTLSVWLVLLAAFSVWGPVLQPEAAASEGNCYYYIRNNVAEVTGYAGGSEEAILPLRLGGVPVGAINVSAFRNAAVTSVFIPATVTQIGNKAFPQGTVLYGEKDTYAEEYAAKNDYKFKSSYVYYPKTVRMNRQEATLPIAQTMQLTATLTPSQTPYSDITWSSSNPKVASVDSSGRVTAIKVGTASIYATAKKGVRAKCVVTVTQPVKQVKLTLSSVVMGKGEKVHLAATMFPSNAYDKTVRWTSDNTSVVKVANGLVTGLREGTATVRAVSVNGPSAACKVTVKAAPGKVSLLPKTVYMGLGETLVLNSTLPQGSASFSQVYQSGNTQKLKVTAKSQSASLTALAKGSVQVKVRTYNGKEASCTVVISEAPTQIRFGTNKITMSVGEKYTLNTFLNDGARSDTRNFSSENPAVVSFSPNNANGELIAKKPGTTKVWVSTYNGKKAYCTVTVVQYSLRKHLVDTALQFVGLHEGDGSHHKVIDIYNSQDPLPVGYRVQYTDDWCATYVSAMAVEAGLTHIVYPECGVERMISLYKKANCWVEDDAYVPQRGDLIFFSWHNNVIGDCQTPASHVAIVADVNNGMITTVEGCIGPNQLYDARVGQRVFAVNDQEIRGFATPAYPE